MPSDAQDPPSRFASLRRLAGFPAQAPVTVGTSYPTLPPPIGPEPAPAAPEEPERAEPAPAPTAPAAPAASAPLAPRRAEELWGGRLRPGEEVGSGATASVIRAVDTKLRRELAIKVTTQPRDKLPTALLARFVEEAQITAQLEHPNVVPVHDMGIDPEGRAYFSMKLVRGASLESILERRAQRDAATLSEFGLRRLLDVFLQVCQAVDYAHARGVVHRDLKPANIMVGDFGEVLVMDWGIAKVKGRPDLPSEPGVSSVRAGNEALATHLGAVLGTPAYMAPEQALGKEVDGRADVYSLGVILYEILAGRVPFDNDDPETLLARLAVERPRPPSETVKDTPAALETLALRMLEKDLERRTLTIEQIRSHVQDYIEGIGHEYRRESLVARGLWLVGALAVFAFLVWYLTGQSVATFVVLTPAVVFNAFGWLLFAIAVSHPLWAAWVSFLASRTEPDRFRPPTREELFVSGFLARRTRAAAIAPLFQLVFIVDLIGATIVRARRGVRSGEIVQSVVTQMRADWSHTLIVVLLFLFAYLLLLSTEVGFARRIDRYVLLARRARWESVWPSFLIVVLLSTVVVTDVAQWMLVAGHRWTFFRERLLMPRLDVFDIVKTLVFQGTFLLGVVVFALLLAFPFPEILASLRMAYQPGDDASVSSRQQYFLRSMAFFEVAGANCLYGGAMIACVAAVKILSEAVERPLVEQVVYIVGPSLIGFAGYALTRRYAAAHLASTPAVQRMLQEQTAEAKDEQARANLEQLRVAPLRWRLVQVAVPVACVLGYLVWTGVGVGRESIRELVMPASTKGWLLILPYALLAPLLLVRDPLQRWLLERHSARQ
jgi:hypothetical protein